jgi:hypothetical protein
MKKSDRKFSEQKLWPGSVFRMDYTYSNAPENLDGLYILTNNVHYRTLPVPYRTT